MNRDESPKREPVESLRQTAVDASEGKRRRVLYPLDPPSDGTWIGVNDQGLVACLMNQHPQGWQRPEKLQSRGLLVPEALRAGSVAEALDRVAAMDQASRAPYMLVVVAPGQAPHSLRWDGQRLRRSIYNDQVLCLSSSSFESSQVQSKREALFDLMLHAAGANSAQLSTETLVAVQDAFHRSQDPVPGPYAVWMTRDDARTVSVSSVFVGHERSTFKYLSRSAAEQGESPWEILLALT